MTIAVLQKVGLGEDNVICPLLRGINNERC